MRRGTADQLSRGNQPEGAWNKVCTQAVWSHRAREREMLSRLGVTGC